MAERFFTKLTNEVLEATEQVANRMEEGLGLLFSSGDASKQQEDAGGSAAGPSSGGDSIPLGEEDDQAHLEEDLRNNPLQGIADGVMGGIMSGQVRRASCESRTTEWLALRSPIRRST